MDFKERISRTYAPLPFYMTYQDNYGWGQEASRIKDFEYLEQTYPKTVKTYQEKINEILDKLDYEGSMIYDEYPDRMSLIGLADTVMNILGREKEMENMLEEEPARRKEVEDMIRVLLCNEIYKRRHCGKKGRFTKF